MKTYLVVGVNRVDGERVLFSGSKADCIDWIWDSCDIGDLRHKGSRNWSGIAYYEEQNKLYEITVDKFYN